MNIKITNDEKNPLFKRRELTAKLGYDNKTPSRQQIRKEISKKEQRPFSRQVVSMMDLYIKEKME